MINGTEITVAGKQIQIDASGAGHAWKNIDADQIPANVVMEIEGEIVDGRVDACEKFTASNGQNYRW